MATLALAVACAGGPPEIGTRRAPAASASSESAGLEIVGWFEGYSETYHGTVHGPPGPSARVELRGDETGVECLGNPSFVRVPLERGPPPDCSEGGVFELACGDGRKVRGSYRNETCQRGRALGVDQFGNTLHFVYGYSEAEIEAVKTEELRVSASRPALPPLDPARTRARLGFHTGTGFFVSGKGHVITSYHLVEAARHVDVLLADGSQERAYFLRGDLEANLALLRVHRSVAALSLAEAAELAEGQRVATVGYPFVGIQGQAPESRGARVRATTVSPDLPAFAELDARFQAGNSGGPLLDERGRVVGVVHVTLQQLVTRRAPEGVDLAYASKLPHLWKLLHEELGEAWRPAASLGALPPGDDLVERTRDAIVLVISR